MFMCVCVDFAWICIASTEMCTVVYRTVSISGSAMLAGQGSS